MPPFSNSVPLGRVLGIKVRAHWSVLIIVLLIALVLATGFLPQVHPGWSQGLLWLVAAVAAVLFLASILAHELAHAAVAKYYKLPVHSITLFLLGGVASFEEDPDSPKKEALMAGAGPLLSLVLGVAISLTAGLMMQPQLAQATDPETAMATIGPVTTLLAWLGPMNILVGIFNLIPAFPMDGGRILRAVLWKALGNQLKATRWAAGIGRGFGWCLALVGLAMAVGLPVPFFGTGLISGIWLILIGWFVSNAARASYQRLTLRQTLTGVPVGRIMRRQIPPSVTKSITVQQLVDEHLVPSGSELFLVLNGWGEPIGWVSSADLMRLPRDEWPARTAGELMSKLDTLKTLNSTDDAYVALRELEKRSRQSPPGVLPVVEEGDITGVVGAREIGRWLEFHAGSDTSERNEAPPHPSQRAPWLNPHHHHPDHGPRSS